MGLLLEYLRINGLLAKWENAIFILDKYSQKSFTQKAITTPLWNALGGVCVFTACVRVEVLHVERLVECVQVLK